jgi:HAD superfamily hydrolase (TIGR01490 family)
MLLARHHTIESSIRVYLRFLFSPIFFVPALERQLVTLALFDIDNTLLNGDSDHAWGIFLAEKGIVDGVEHRAKQEFFYREYLAGRLEIDKFLKFQLAPLRDNEMTELLAWRREFMRKKILPIIGESARTLVDYHRNRDHQIILITATNSFVTEPIAQEFGADLLIATEPEQNEEGFTGAVDGPPCFKEGKVSKLNAWLATSSETLTGSWFYSDSRNDIPLLEAVDNPVAVHPDEALEKTALEKGWPIMNLYDGEKLNV